MVYGDLTSSKSMYNTVYIRYIFWFISHQIKHMAQRPKALQCTKELRHYIKIHTKLYKTHN